MNHWINLLGLVSMPTPGGGGDQGAGGLLGSPLMLIVMIAVMFYFVLYMPEKKRKAERERMLKGLERGDEVITSGGVYGKITAVTENTVTLEIAPNVRIKVGTQFVTGVPSKDKSGKETKDKDKNGDKKSSQ